MSVGISVKGVKPFDGTNFQGWKAQVNALFVMNDVLDIVDGKREEPAAGNAAELKKNVKDDATAKFIILSNLDEAQQVCVLSCISAKEMWNKLCLIHEQKTVTNKLGLLQRFHAYRMSEADTAVQHVAKIMNMASQLKDVGEDVSDATVMAKILASLTTKFSTLQVAWDSVEPARQTLDNLQERLIREDARLISDEETSEALAATAKNRRPQGAKNTQNKNKNKKELQCYKCQKMGHFARQCRNKRKPRDDSEKSQDCEKSRDCAFVVETDKRSVERGSKSAENTHVLWTQSHVMTADQSEVWLIDSGASRHLTYRRDWLTDYKTDNTGATISLGDNQTCNVAGEGTVLIKKLIDGVWHDARIEKVLHVPKLRKNLFSVGVCTKRGLSVKFKINRVEVVLNSEVLATGMKQGNDVYRMFFKVAKEGSAEEANIATTNLTVWHERLGHVGKRAIREMAEKGLVSGVSITDKSDVFCEPCQMGKLHRLPFNKKLERDKKIKPGEKMHSDVCGPMSTNSIGGSRYFLTFKDEATGYRHVYFMKKKSEVFEKFKIFEKMIENKFGRKMKTLRSDNGREFFNKEMNNYLEKCGIQRETSAPYNPEQNGKAERDNRTIVESARTMIIAKNLPLSLWAEAVNCAIYVLNRTVWTNGAVTPYGAWAGKTPNLKHLRIFGSDVYVHTPKQFTRKFDARASKQIFVGYTEESTNYRVYDPKTMKVSIARNVVFNEKVGVSPANEEEKEEENAVSLPRPQGENEHESGNVVNAEGDNSDGEEQGEKDNNEAVGRENVPTRDGQIVLRDRSKIQTPIRYRHNADVAEYIEPMTYVEAMNSTEAAQWAGAIKNEFRAHENNNTWKLVKKTPEMRLIDSKWVFRVKKDTDGKSHRFKARLCARGFLQREVIDFEETFSPVVRYDSLRVLLAMIAAENLEVMQFDVQTAFLYGELEETIFMKIPEGLKVEEDPRNIACKLERSLYGLKQAPRCWNLKFTKFLNKYNLKECEADKCVFVGKFENDIVYLALFVDDGLVASNNVETLKIIIKRLSETFKITVENSNVFVGMQIERDRERKTLMIHQSAYTRKIIKKFGMADAKTVSVPADPHAALSPTEEDEKESNNVPYREAVGSLVFLAAVSRPDIAFAVNSVSKYLSKHNATHWRAVKRIFAYLQGTIDYGIKYVSGGSEAMLIGFSDADYAGDVETRRSTTGYVFCLSNGAVTWSSQRQRLVTLSTTEAEYVAASTAAREVVWLRRLLSDIGCPCDKETTLYVDNQSAIHLVRNPVFHKRTKHIDVHFHFIREKVNEGKIRVEYVPSENQRADMFTKALPRDRFNDLCFKLNMTTIRGKHLNGGSVKIS